MNFKDDYRLTAFALGEFDALTEEEKSEIETALENDLDLQAEVQNIKQTNGVLDLAFSHEKELKIEQKEAIKNRLKEKASNKTPLRFFGNIAIAASLIAIVWVGVAQSVKKDVSLDNVVDEEKNISKNIPKPSKIFKSAKKEMAFSPLAVVAKDEKKDLDVIVKAREDIVATAVTYEKKSSRYKIKENVKLLQEEPVEMEEAIESEPTEIYELADDVVFGSPSKYPTLKKEKRGRGASLVGGFNKSKKSDIRGLQNNSQSTSPFSVKNSLILRGNDNYVAHINPSQCIVQIYQHSKRNMKLIAYKGFYNEVYQLLHRIHPEAPDFSILRMGTTHKQPTLPSYSDSKEGIFALFSKKPPKVGVESFYNRVVKGENNFWSKDLKYDGIITADNGDDFILLCLPSLHTLIAFNVNGNKISMTNWRNYGPDLVIPDAYNSSPSSTELLNKMSKEVKEDFKSKIEDIEEGLIGNTDASLDLKKSIPWIKNIEKNRFIMLDALNERLLCYEVIGKGVIKLQAVRNLEIDLLLTANPKKEKQLLKIYAKDLGNKAFSKDELLLLLEDENLKSNEFESDIDASVTPSSLVLHSQDRYLSLLYALGNSGKKWIELLSHDNTRIETAILVHRSLLMKKEIAKKELKKISKHASKSKVSKKSILKSLDFILEYDPSLHKEIGKDRNIVKKVGELQDFQKLLAKAKLKHEENIKKAKSRKEKLQKLRNQK